MILWLALQDVWVRFQDGGLWRARWEAGPVAIEAGGAPVVLASARVERVVPGVWYGEAFERAVDQAFRELGDDRIEVREAATRKVLGYGTIVTERLKRASRGEDPEVAARARRVLDQLARGEGGRLPPARLDRVEAGERIYEGKLTQAECVLRWRAVDVRVPWNRVAELSRRGPPPQPDERPMPWMFRRLGRDAFASSDRTITFDRDVRGRPIEQGIDVEELYREWGVIFDSEDPHSVVYADGFEVESVSRGNSGANRKPQWVGHVNLFFFLPGTIAPGERHGVTAGVFRVGVFVAAVTPGGTGLRAYDAAGNVVDEILTTETGTDFLGLQSPVPIHRVEIFDDPNIDQNFTTDDFVFGPIVAPGARREHFVVALTGGERVVAGGVRGDERELRLTPSVGGSEAAVPWGEVREVYAPLDRIRFEAPMPREARAPEPGDALIDLVSGRTSGRITAWDDRGIRLGNESIEWERVVRIERRR